MAPTRRNNEGLLARVNFPLYALQMVTNRHVLVAGGGGSANTGVANGFEIFEISHDGHRFVAEEVIRHETGPSVVMNCATRSDGKRTFLVAGQESHCQLYNVGMEVRDFEKESSDINKDKDEDTLNSNIRHRKKSESESNVNNPENKHVDNKSRSKTDTEGNTKPRNESATNSRRPMPSKSEEKRKGKMDSNSNMYKRLTINIKPNDSIQTDFSKDEPLQRVVRISPASGELMVTGGTDGILRVWDFPQMTKKLEIKAHTKEIDDLDFSPNDMMVASIAKDGLALLWNINSGDKIRSLTWTPPEGSKYLYKRCRFGVNEGSVDKSRLFLLTNPIGRPGKLKAYLQLWNPSDGSLKKVMPYDESLSALAVSDDGRFVAVGTMFSGSVSIHIAFSLQRVLLVSGAHSMFVTGLEFLPRSEYMVTSRSEAAVLSISVDNKVCVHSLAYRHTLPMWFGLVIMFLVICFAFVLMSYLGV